MCSPLANNLEWTRISDSNTESVSAPADVKMYFGDNALLPFLRFQLERSKYIEQLCPGDSQ
jgi:hypothetical protein